MEKMRDAKYRGASKVDERKKIKIRKDQHSGDSQEFKILNDMEMCFKATSNALYGVMGYPGFILYDQRVASSVTFVGREVLKHIKKSEAPFGGLQVVLCGDFFQRD